MSWYVKVVDLGRILPNTTYTVTYQASPDSLGIKKMASSCGCSVPKYNSKTKELSVEFKSGPMPRHLIGLEQTFTKSIHLTYDDGTTDVLSFKGTKTETL